jgi:hypothetical protein
VNNSSSNQCNLEERTAELPEFLSRDAFGCPRLTGHRASLLLPDCAEETSMSIQGDLMLIKHVLEWLICPSILLVLVASLIVRYRSDLDRILDEADSKDTEVLSIRWCWLPFRYGPFSWWECLLPGSRVFRVQARERSGKERTGYVLIGPRRLASRWESWESQSEQWYGTLTWRWAETRRSTSE